MSKVLSNEVTNKVTKIIIGWSQLTLSNKEIEKINADSSLEDEFGIDSFDIEGIVMLLENEFEIQIADSDIEGINTVGDCINLIWRELGIE